MSRNTTHSVNGINYSVNIKRVKDSEYYVVNFRNSQGKVVTRSTGLKPDKNSLRQAEKRAKEIVGEYIAEHENNNPSDMNKVSSHANKNLHNANTVSDCEENIVLEYDGILFVDFIEDWVNRKKPLLRSTTYDNYISMIKAHIAPYFNEKGLKLTDIKPMHLQAYINKKLETLSSNTVRKHMSLIQTAMHDALINDLIASNPAEKVTKPRYIKPKHTYYKAEGLEKLLNEVKGSVIEVPVFIAAMFGLRRSEVLGLRWCDIDFENKTLTVNGSVTRRNVDGKWTDVFDTTLKTEASNGTYVLNDSVCEYFHSIYEKNQSLISNTNDYKEFICVNAVGERLKLDFVTHKFSELLEEHGLKHIRFHDLRHSVLSLLSKKYSTKVVQGYARHASCQITSDLYCHFDNDDTLMELDTVCKALNFGE